MNLGNTCYLNAVVQALFSILGPIFFKDKDCRELFPRDSLTGHLVQLMSKMWGSAGLTCVDCSPINPVALVQFIQSVKQEVLIGKKRTLVSRFPGKQCCFLSTPLSWLIYTYVYVFRLKPWQPARNKTAMRYCNSFLRQCRKIWLP